jgi:hypothetical protein
VFQEPKRNPDAMENALEPPGGSKYGDNPPQFLLDAMMVWLSASLSFPCKYIVSVIHMLIFSKFRKSLELAE